MPKISLSLSSSSINKAISELKSYAAKVKTNTEEIVKEVAEQLEDNLKSGFNGASYDYIVEDSILVDGIGRVPNVRIDSTQSDKGMTVTAHGEEAVFVEFGAGVYFNPGGAPHPARGGNIKAIGEYGHGHGKQVVWELPDGRKTHGTPASMPMYLGAQEIAEEIPEIAKQVFEKSG